MSRNMWLIVAALTAAVIVKITLVAVLAGPSSLTWLLAALPVLVAIKIFTVPRFFAWRHRVAEEKQVLSDW